MATAPDTTLGKQMEDLLRCSICKETLTEPRTLGCYHSFCKECLANHAESQREEAEKDHEHRLFNCPLCRTQFQGESVEQLPPNIFINNLLEMLSIQERAPHLACESCSGHVSATCRCVECEHYLCKNCLAAHNKWPALNSHVVLTIEELTKPENHAKAKAQSRCHKNGHENELLKFYCNTCQELACITCVILDHSKPEHDCQPAGVVAEQHKEELKRTSTILQIKFNESQGALQKIKRASQTLQTNTKKAKDAILQQEKEILEEFTKKLKRNTAILIVEVERKHNEVNRKIVKQHDEMKAYIEKVNGSLKFAKNIIEKGSNEEILSLVNAVELNANSIEKKCPKVMLPVHYGYFKYLQKKSSRNVVDNYVDLDDLGKIGKFTTYTHLRTRMYR
jgi:tripartite motif-containing protein 2/3